MNNNLFSVVIPTMWKSSKVLNTLEVYEKSKYVGEIILIDNNPTEKVDLSKFKKIKYYSEGKNIFVNPSWNVGYSLSKYRLILSNDDLIINEIDNVFREIIKSNYDIIGIDLNYPKNGNVFISDLNVFPSKGYGCFMYVKNYYYIPEQFKIWFGDNILFEKSTKKGILKNVSVYYELSTTVKYIRKSFDEDIIQNDIDNYKILKQNEENFNIIIRTSGRPNFFKNCFNSVIKHFPTAKLHITIDNIDDLKYVQEIVKGVDFNYYVVNKRTIYRITEKIPIERQRFIYNYYFNVVKPFLNGWCMFLDDDDMMINKPIFDLNDTNIVNIFKVDLLSSIVPSQVNFGKRPILNNINTSCVIVHSSKLIDWIPHRGGDFDFINTLFKFNKFKWIDEIIVQSQIGGNYGKRNDLKQLQKFELNGFYLNLDYRPDRREKMEKQLSKVNVNFDRFPAIDGTKIELNKDFKGTITNSETKQYATYLSHYEMIKYAKENNWSNLIILEDDVTLCDDFDSRLDFFVNILPNDWKIAYLGFNEQQDTKLYQVNEFIFRVDNVLGCFGMIINGNFYEELLSIIERFKQPIDEIIKSYVQKKYSCYSFIPFFLYVNDDFSDIWNKHRVLDRIKKYFEPKLPQRLNFDSTIKVHSIFSDDSWKLIEPKEKNSNKLKHLINFKQKETKTIIKEPTNYVLEKVQPFYQVNKTQKSIRPNIPINRNEITELRKESLARTSKDLQPKGKKYKG